MTCLRGLPLIGLIVVVALSLSRPSAAQYVAVDLGTLGGSDTRPVAVNEQGQVVGWGLIAGDLAEHAFSWTAANGIVDLGTLGGTRSVAVAVNDNGEVVGWSQTTGNVAVHAFRWTAADGLVDLGTLGSAGSGGGSEASDNNNAGQVVGESQILGIPSERKRAFVWTVQRGMVNLGTLGGTYSRAYAVNAAGQVVGASRVAGDLTTHAFSWTPDGGMLDLGTLGGTYSVAVGVTDGGQVIGWSLMSGDTMTHGFSWSRIGGVVDIGTLGGSDTHPNGVNENGNVVGTSATPAGEAHAFLWRAANGMADLGTLGGTESFGSAISNTGQIVGSGYTDGNATTHAFSWTAADGLVDLGAPGGIGSSAVDVNDKGQIVGFVWTAGHESIRATMWMPPDRDDGAPLPVPWASADVGDVGTPGSASQVDDRVVVVGAGDDIWGTADAFRFAYRPLSGAGSVTAHVAAANSVRAYSNGAFRVEAPSEFAKAGVMMRASTDPASPSVILDAKPDGGLEFMVRYASGESTHFIAGASAAPQDVWLWLAREPGNQITSAYSSDGVTWTSLGTVAVPFSADEILAGLAVTSHRSDALYAAQFDHVSVSGSLEPNLLVNGDFEAYDPPALGPPGWISDHEFRQSPAKSETHQPHSGLRNGACWTMEYLDCGIYQDVIAPATGTYTYTVYATADRAGGLVGANLNGLLAASRDVTAASFGVYSRYTMTVTASGGDVIRVWMYSPASPGYVVIDDASLVLAGE